MLQRFVRKGPRAYGRGLPATVRAVIPRLQSAIAGATYDTIGHESCARIPVHRGVALWPQNNHASWWDVAVHAIERPDGVRDTTRARDRGRRPGTSVPDVVCRCEVGNCDGQKVRDRQTGHASRERPITARSGGLHNVYHGCGSAESKTGQGKQTRHGERRLHARRGWHRWRCCQA